MTERVPSIRWIRSLTDDDILHLIARAYHALNSSPDPIDPIARMRLDAIDEHQRLADEWTPRQIARHRAAITR
jgi:hypothetical protein